jgi:dinuclear metal center YbgI/SA1388 family protein
MKVADVVRVMEALAPTDLAADWDNVGLLLGDLTAKVSKVLVCVDLTEPVLAEALRVRAQMVVAHHPVIFQSVARLTAEDTPVVYAAARRGLAVYAAHTNLDVARGGTNDVLAEALGLADRRPLEPVAREEQCKVVTFVSPDDLSRVGSAAFVAGAGRIGNYRDCAFFCHGIGSFVGALGSRPAVGQAGRHEVTEELRLEMICARSKAAGVCAAIRAAHGYEEPAIDVYALGDASLDCGYGRVGKLKRPVTVQTLINRMKKLAGARKVRLATAPGGRRGDGKGALVTTAACCAGSGGSYVRAAVAQGATFYAAGEVSHHDAVEAVAAGMTVVCLGHGNSERLAMARLAERLCERLPKLKVAAAQQDRDPYSVV